MSAIDKEPPGCPDPARAIILMMFMRMVRARSSSSRRNESFRGRTAVCFLSRLVEPPNLVVTEG